MKIFLLFWGWVALSIPTFTCANTALLIIDLQRGVTEAEGPYSIGGERSEQLLQNVLEHLQIVREKGYQVIFIVNQWPAWRFLENWWFDNAFRVGSPWADLDPRLGTPEILLVKSYADAFSNPNLDLLLRQKQVDKLLVAGLFADACIYATVKTAIKKGHTVGVLANAVVTKKAENLVTALSALEKIGAEIIH